MGQRNRRKPNKNSRSDCLKTAAADPDLQRILSFGPSLPEHVRQTMRSLIDAVSGPAGKAGINMSTRPAGAAVPPGIVRDLSTLVRQGDRFPTIYAHPPWAYDNRTSRGAAARRRECSFRAGMRVVSYSAR